MFSFVLDHSAIAAKSQERTDRRSAGGTDGWMMSRIKDRIVEKGGNVQMNGLMDRRVEGQINTNGFFN